MSLSHYHILALLLYTYIFFLNHLLFLIVITSQGFVHISVNMCAEHLLYNVSMTCNDC